MIPKPLTIAIVGLLLAATLGAHQMAAAEPIDLSLKDAEVTEILRAFARITGMNIVIDPTVEGTVTVDIDSMPWDEAMTMICDLASLRCVIEEATPSVIRVSPIGEEEEDDDAEMSISLDLKKADLRETLRAFGAIGGREVTIHPDVKGTVTLTVEGPPWPLVLAEVCRLSGCRATIDETHIEVIPDATPQPRTRLDLTADETPLVDVLAAFEQRPVFGDELFLSLELAPALRDRPITLDLDDTPWGEAMAALCAQAGCTWKVVHGAPPVLAVLPSDPNLERQIAFSVSRSPLRGVAEGLAGLVALEAFVPPALGPDQLVDLVAHGIPWRMAMDRLCTQVGCSWDVRGARLVLRPQVRALMVQPQAGSRAPGLMVRAFAPDASLPMEDTARFTWTRPVATMPVGGDDPQQLILTWIPFGPEHHVVLPSLAPCSAAQEDLRAQLLETVHLPLAAPWSTTWFGTVIELTPDAHDKATGRAEAPARACTTDLAIRLAAIFRPAGQDSGMETQELPMHLGRYLLISPPATLRAPNPQPVAAVVFLGAATGGGQTVAVVRPTDGRGAAVEQLILSADENRTINLESPGSPGLALDLRLAMSAP